MDAYNYNRSKVAAKAISPKAKKLVDEQLYVAKKLVSHLEAALNAGSPDEVQKYLKYALTSVKGIDLKLEKALAAEESTP